MGIVKIINGDIFSAFDKGKFDIIGHGCNCMNLMGAGIADKISKLYPKAYETDTEVYLYAGGIGHKPCENLLGNFSVARLEQGRIANLYTQLKTGKDARYSALESSLKQLNRYCEINQLKKVGLPMIGAGIGGLDSQAVTVIINQVMKSVDVYLYVYEGEMYHKLRSGWKNYCEPEYFAGVVVFTNDVVTLFRRRKGKIHQSNPPVEKMSLSNALVTHLSKSNHRIAVTFGSDADTYIYARTDEDVEEIFSSPEVTFLDAKN